MCNDPRIITEYEQNLAEQFLRNKMIADANSQGIEQGSLQEKNQVAINLLKEKMPYDLISKVTGLTAEKIKDIEKNTNQE